VVFCDLSVLKELDEVIKFNLVDMALDLQEWIKIMEGFENGNSKNSTPTNTPKIE
jgi:hypothetical protein